MAPMKTMLLVLALVSGLVAPLCGQPVALGTPLTTSQEAIQSLAAAPANPAEALARLRADLGRERVTGLDGRSTDLLSKLESLPEGVLSGAQRQRVLGALSEIYEMNLRLEASIPQGPGKGYQMVNWQHTRTEVNEIVDAMLKFNTAAAKAGRPLLTATQIEDAMLAAAFSDSVKLPPGANGNFFRHHLDGAEAARVVAERYYPGDTARVQGIVSAIQEHQIVPPEFMGNLARHGMVGRQTGELTAAFAREFPGDLGADGKPNFASENGRVLKGVLDRVNAATAVEGNRSPAVFDEAQVRLLNRLGVQAENLTSFTTAVNGARDRIASPLTQPRSTDGTRIAFSPAEANALRGIGINDWILPVADAPHAQISTFVRVGDTAANYMSSPAGLAKIIAIRGPGTPFADHTVWDSIRSAEKSFNDALKVIPEDYRPALQEMRGRTITAIREQGADVRQWVNANKARAGYAADEPVLFFDKRASTAGLSTEQVAARTEFAKEIRGQFETGLRARQDAFANVGRPAYDAEALGAKMAAQVNEPVAARGASEPVLGNRTAVNEPVRSITEPVVARTAVNEPVTARGQPAPIAEGTGAPSLLGVRAATVTNVAAHAAKGTVIGAGVGVAIEAGRELITDGKIDGKTLWNNTLGNLNEFWKPLAGGTAGALAAGAIAARFLPGGGVLAAGAQFLGGSLGASAASGHLTREPGRAAAGAVGSAVGAVAGGAALSWLLPPVGSFIGSTAGGIAGQVAGEWLYEKFKPSPQVAARPQLRGMNI